MKNLSGVIRNLAPHARQKIRVRGRRSLSGSLDEASRRASGLIRDVVRPETVEGRKDLQSFSKRSRTPITRGTTKPVNRLVILSPNPSLQMKLTDDYAAGNGDAHNSPVDERYRLWLLKNPSFLPNSQNLGDTECLENQKSRL
jgi:hypothetical protein